MTDLFCDDVVFVILGSRCKGSNVFFNRRVGSFFLCVRDVLLVMFSNLYNAGAARRLRARIYARVRQFLFFAFTSSPVCPK